MYQAREYAAIAEVGLLIIETALDLRKHSFCCPKGLRVRCSRCGMEASLLGIPIFEEDEDHRVKVGSPALHSHGLVA